MPQDGPHPEVMPNSGSGVGFHGLDFIYYNPLITFKKKFKYGNVENFKTLMSYIFEKLYNKEFTNIQLFSKLRFLVIYIHY